MSGATHSSAAVALRIGTDAMIAYDDELQQATAAAGLTAVSPR